VSSSEADAGGGNSLLTVTIASDGADIYPAAGGGIVTLGYFGDPAHRYGGPAVGVHFRPSERLSNQCPIRQDRARVLEAEARHET